MFDVKVNTRLLHTAKVKQKALPGFEGAQMNSSGAKPFMLVLGAFDFLNVCLLLSETEDPKRLQQCLGSLLEPKVKQTTPLKCGGDLMITDLKRMGVNDEDSAWRISTINTSYSVIQFKMGQQLVTSLLLKAM